MQESNEKNEEFDSYISRTIEDEVLRQRVRNLISEPESESWLSRFSHNPLVIMIVAFLLIGLICIRLINFHFSQQKRSAPHSVSRQTLDELNRIRVSKIGETWQKADLYDAALEAINTGPDVTINEKHVKVEQLYVELSTVLASNRYWLGEQIYDGLHKYTDITYKGFLGLKSEQSDQKVEEMKEKRQQARAELNQLRNKIFNGEIY
jgi:hypothetical protein